MARLDVRPVACQVAESGWSQVLILSKSSELNTEPNIPTWVIAITLKGPSAILTGPELLKTISDAYEQLELKTPESLYHLLQESFTDQLHASVAAASISSHQMTLFGLGTYQIQLCRNDKCGTVLRDGHNQNWRVVEGEWKETDRWSLVAGESDSLDIAQILAIDNLEQAAETLHGELATNNSLSLANALIHINPSLPDFVSSTTFSTDPKVIKKRRVMMAGCLLLVLLAISIGFGSKARTEQRHAANFSQLEATTTTSLAAALAVKDGDQSRARQQLKELQTIVNQEKKQYENDKKWLAKWTELSTKVDVAYQELAGETAVANLPEWFSLSVIKAGLMGDKLILAGGNMLILDKASSSLVKIGLNSKKGELMVSSNSLANPKAITASTSKAYTLTNTGIIETILSSKNSTTLVEADSEWLNPEHIATFNGNMYVFDSGVATIWRYPATASGLGSKQTWLGNGVSLPGGQINSMAVDGDIWLLKPGGIARFRRGAPLSFTISGLDQPLSSNTPAFSISSDQDRVAILDAGNQRIVLLTKQGTYLKQIQWSGLANAKDIVLSPDAASIYILANGFIYSANW